MAHRKFENDKIQTVMPTWHGLEERKDIITLEDNWLTEWDLSPAPLFFEGGEASGFSVLRCTDDAAIRIGGAYNPETFKPIDNAAFLALIGKSIAGTKHEIVSVGSVRNRGRVFLTLKLNGMEKFKAAGREFSAYLNFGNGHDKSSVLWVNTSNTCTVCDNTFSANLFSVEASQKSGSQTEEKEIKISLRHTKNANMRFPEVSNLIDKAIGVQAEFALAMEEAAKISIPETTARQVFAGFVAGKEAKKLRTRAENTSERLFQLFKGGAGNNGRNIADLISAVTDYYTHESAGGDNRAKQFVSSEFGSANAKKAEFFALARNPERLKDTAKRGAELLATV